MKSLIDILQGFGNIATFLIVTGALVGVAILLPTLRQRLGFTLRKEATDGASDAYKAIVSSLIFVLAFAMFQVQSNFREAEQLVEKEADHLNLIDRTLLRFDSPEANALRALTVEYAGLVIAKEWPLMRVSDRSAEVDAVFDKVAAGEKTLKPSNPGQQAQLGIFDKAWDELSDLREARLAVTYTSLPPLTWTMIIGLLILLVVIVTFTPATVDKLMAHSGLLCAAGLMLSLIVILDGPFKGETSVPPDQIAHTLKVIQARR